jgi:hypothetical protein
MPQLSAAGEPVRRRRDQVIAFDQRNMTPMPAKPKQSISNFHHRIRWYGLAFVPVPSRRLGEIVSLETAASCAVGRRWLQTTFFSRSTTVGFCRERQNTPVESTFLHF